MKVLVTGGAGFIGSYVVRALLGAGHEPFVFDRKQPDEGTFIRGDLTEKGDVLAATSDEYPLCQWTAIAPVFSGWRWGEYAHAALVAAPPQS